MTDATANLNRPATKADLYDLAARIGEYRGDQQRMAGHIEHVMSDYLREMLKIADVVNSLPGAILSLREQADSNTRRIAALEARARWCADCPRMLPSTEPDDPTGFDAGRQG